MSNYGSFLQGLLLVANYSNIIIPGSLLTTPDHSHLWPNYLHGDLSNAPYASLITLANYFWASTQTPLVVLIYRRLSCNVASINSICMGLLFCFKAPDVCYWHSYPVCWVHGKASHLSEVRDGIEDWTEWWQFSMALIIIRKLILGHSTFS